MLILRTTNFSEREAYIKGFKEGATEVLDDSLKEAVKTPVRYDGKAVKEMLDYAEDMKDRIPDIAEEAANEEKLYSENLRGIIQRVIDETETMKIGKFKIMEDETDGDTICLSGGLNGRGIWSNYFEVLSKFMFRVELRFPDAYVVKLVNDTLDDVFYLTIKIPKDQEQEDRGALKDLEGKEFSDREVPKRGNKKPGNRERVPKSIVKKVMNGEGVIHKYNGSWRIVSMKTNPPTFWEIKSDSKEKCEKILAAYHSNKH